MSPNTGGAINIEGDLFPTLPGVASAKGVAMNPPPAAIFSDVHKLVSEAMANIPDGERAQLVAIATEQGGKVDVNLALAVKAGSHVEVVSWIGKTWGTPVAAGVVGKVHF